MNRSTEIDKYIEGFPEHAQAALNLMREAILELAPEAEERISYGMPAYRLNGNLVYFSGFERHIGFYALPTAHAEFRSELAGYKVGKGSVQFPLDRPLPLSLIKKMVKFRISENMQRMAAKAKGR